MKASRRQFVQGAGVVSLGLVAGCAWPTGPSRSASSVARVGVLSPSGAEFGQQNEVTPLRQQLVELGYADSQHAVIDARFAAGDVNRLAELADQLLAVGVAVIVAGGPDAVRAAKGATERVPIVMVGASQDPVAAGFVDSLAQPGGNVTGLATGAVELTNGKRLELLKESVPGLSRVALLRAAGLRLPQRSDIADEARVVGVQVEEILTDGPDGLEAAMGAVQARAEGMVMTAGTLLVANQDRVIELGLRYRVPMISTFREFAVAGGLMAYGVAIPDLWRRAANYVARILQGTNPAELPVEQAMRYDFVINLRTAQALGITIPPHVLLQATEVIQ